MLLKLVPQVNRLTNSELNCVTMEDHKDSNNDRDDDNSIDDGGVYSNDDHKKIAERVNSPIMRIKKQGLC